mgnify:CR=1 FL=1
MEIKIIRSEKRKKTVGARFVNGVCEVRAPASLSDAELQPIARKLMVRLQQREQAQALDDAALERVAKRLNNHYFGGRLSWNAIKWVTNQNTRVGSCTPSKGTIRISHRAASMPTFVRDYVIMHELSHLVEPNHSRKFWKLVEQYPKTERARGYLMALGAEPLEDEPGP